MRTKSNRMELIRKLNLCGNDLQNISVLRHMSNLEVVSLSVNRVSTLADFSNCPRLSELYLRKNDIRDLAEVQYLMDLRQLKVLWLSENPCANLPHYRTYVLHHLPGLTKLDAIDVTDDEKRRAVRTNMDNVPTCVDLECDGAPVAEAVDFVEEASEQRDQRAARRASEPDASMPKQRAQQMLGTAGSLADAKSRRFSGPSDPPVGDTQGAFERKQHAQNSRGSGRHPNCQDSSPVPRNERPLNPAQSLRGDRLPAASRQRVEPVHDGLSFEGEDERMRAYEDASFEQLPPQPPPQDRPYSAPYSHVHHGEQTWQDGSELSAAEFRGSMQRYASGTSAYIADNRKSESRSQAWPSTNLQAAVDFRGGATPVAAVEGAARADNILCAVLALIKELDQQGLELVRRAIEQRQCEQ